MSSSQAFAPPLQLSPIGVDDVQPASGSGTAADGGDPLTPAVSLSTICTEATTREAAPVQPELQALETSVAGGSLDLGKQAAAELGEAQDEQMPGPDIAEDAGVPVDVSVVMDAPSAAQVTDPSTGSKDGSLKAQVSSDASYKRSSLDSHQVTCQSQTCSHFDYKLQQALTSSQCAGARSVVFHTF